jgi:hypothetical protein
MAVPFQTPAVTVPTLELVAVKVVNTAVLGVVLPIGVLLIASSVNATLLKVPPVMDTFELVRLVTVAFVVVTLVKLNDPPVIVAFARVKLPILVVVLPK